MGCAGRRVLCVLAAVAMCAGACFLLLPVGNAALISIRSTSLVHGFRTQFFGQDRSAEDEAKQMIEWMESYNSRIYEEGQGGLCDAWSYEQIDPAYGGQKWSTEIVAVIQIPAMNVELPVYVGASEENLKKGAAVLGQTSMPAGGENTNCVIAAHRGYRGSAMFRDIENLVPGDQVYVDNAQERLTYEVVNCIAIQPDDIDAVRILPGRDLLTLITCHPYTQNSQRYVVYCSRADTSSPDGTDAEGTVPIPDDEGVPFVSSQADIQRERFVTAGGFLCLAVVCVTLLFILVEKRKK